MVETTHLPERQYSIFEGSYLTWLWGNKNGRNDAPVFERMELNGVRREALPTPARQPTWRFESESENLVSKEYAQCGFRRCGC